MLAFKDIFSGFSVPDLAKAKEFYGTTLGLQLEEVENMGLKLSLPSGGYVFIYHSEKNKAAEFTILNLKVDDIDLAVDELTKKGITFERYDDMPAPQDEKGVLRGKSAQMGPNIAWFKDPFGNILSVIEE